VSDKPISNSRRAFLKTGLLAIPTVTLASHELEAEPPRPAPVSSQVFFTEAEKTFLRAAVDRLIPEDEWPSASQLNVVEYIDRQMAGKWGKGDLSYRTGPFHQGTPSQGYQLEYTPAEVFRRSILAISHHWETEGTSFHRLSPTRQDEYLSALQTKHIDLNGVPSPTFFGLLWKHTVEGFFADPTYGGNKDKVGWQMLGFPGAYTDFYDLVDQHNVKFERMPIGMADGMHMHMSGHGNGKG
jgi:gluconate 2-dehydrogenase gamma chain